MVLRLDPRLPLVWRSPSNLQIGVTRPVAVLDDVTVVTERMLAALSGGVPRSGLGMIGRAGGLSDAQIDQFVSTVTPALERSTPSGADRVIVVTGEGAIARATALLLEGEGYTVRRVSTVSEAETTGCDLAVAVGSFVLEPELHGLWLRRDLPHLAIVVGDGSVSVGPLVEPGRSACLYCVQLHATDADPAWPAIASQLWGRSAAAETPLAASEAAAIAARLVGGWFGLGAAAASSARVVTLDAATGSQTVTEVAPHPDCGCLEPGLANAAVVASA